MAIRAGERLRYLEAQIERLAAQVLALEGQVRSAGFEPIHVPTWARGLPPQEAALLGALYGAYPRVLSIYDLDDALPRYDHVLDRDLKVVAVCVHKVRKRFGLQIIETVRGRGYRLSDVGKAQMHASDVAMAAE
jgi:DNA-binding response OmpR family regulator